LSCEQETESPSCVNEIVLEAVSVEARVVGNELSVGTVTVKVAAVLVVLKMLGTS
jgi:hypothetical protein